MKILLISYGDLRFDGRLRSLISVFEQIGDVVSYTRGEKPVNFKSVVDNATYISFISHAIRFANKMGKIDLLVLDNRKATVPGLIIQQIKKPDFTVQDCRELYLKREVKHLSGKIGCFFEQIMMKKSDIIICANEERATIMQNEFRLRQQPLSYENLRRLEYESAEALEAAKKKLSVFFHNDEYGIISSSGCSFLRTNDILVKNLPKVNYKCRLFLVGENSDEEEKKIRQLMQERDINNIEILGKLNQTELKYLISQCHIGIVNYGQYDTNNRLCASGKLYEFLYEGIPVVTTTNPPLKTICVKYGIGVADDHYYEGINCVLANYSSYKQYVQEYAESHTVQKNDSELVSSLKAKLG